MNEFNLNLSTRPFPAYQLKTILLAVALVALAGVSVWQAFGYLNYSALAAGIRDDARNSQVQSEALGRRLAEIDAKLSTPEATQKLKEIEFLNRIILQKSFAWTRIFANLEQIMPDGVQLINIRPEFSPAGVDLRIDVRGRGMTDITQMLEALQSSPAFSRVEVFTEKNRESAPSNNAVEVMFKATYHAEREGQ
jgi:Tfp pilus assembly protein PilN